LFLELNTAENSRITKDLLSFEKISKVGKTKKTGTPGDQIFKE
jgi:hypothetical protein